MSSFKDFKSKMKSADAQEKLKSSFEKKSYTDERYWQPKADKQGNYNGVIRFLPAGDGEEKFYQQIQSYYFHNKKTDQYYIENSLRTLGRPDPVNDENQKMWQTGDETKRDIARKRRVITKFIGNVYVINDPANPDNNGKVFLYKYGKAIHNIIHAAIKPQFADEQPINPYNPWDEGANFKLRIFKDQSTNLPNYDKSAFESPSAMFDGDDDKIQSEIFDKLYPILPEVAPDKFKTYDELKARLYLVEGLGDTTPTSRTEDINDDFVESKQTQKAAATKPVESPFDDDDLPDEIKALLED